MKKAGFSIVEVVIVVVVLAILGGLGYVAYDNFVVAPAVEQTSMPDPSTETSEPPVIESSGDLEQATTDLNSLDLDDGDDVTELESQSTDF